MQWVFEAAKKCNEMTFINDFSLHCLNIKELQHLGECFENNVTGCDAYGMLDEYSKNDSFGKGELISFKWTVKSTPRLYI